MGVKFSYNNLDWFVPWYLDDYLQLNDQQEDAFDAHLKVIWNWHRHNQLPQYSTLLNEIISDLDKQQVTLERLHYYGEQTNSFYHKVIHKALQEGLPLLQSLDEPQLKELYENFDETDQEFKEYFADNDLKQREKKQLKSINKTFKKWIGKLTKKQKRLLKAWTKETESTTELRIQYSEKVRLAFKQAMSGRKNTEQMRKQLLLLATQPGLLQSKELTDKRERNNQRFRQLLLDTLSTLSKKQQKKLRRKILSYAEDFSDLSVKTD